MPFPEFDPQKKKILFFSRGRGRGHAIPDMEIIEEIAKRRGDVEVRLVSYGTGAETFAQHGFEVINLNLPDEGGVAELTALCGRLIGWLEPDLVVSHEEFPAPPVAKIFELPVVFIADWLLDPESYPMHTLKFAEHVILTDEEGAFPVPDYLRGRVECVGRHLREFAYSTADRARAREELGLPPAATMLAAIPGGYATEERAPLAELLLAAFDLWKEESKLMAWVAGSDFKTLARLTGGRADVRVVERVEPIDRLMSAADVAVTKANRGSVLELRAMGVPVVAVTQGDNPLDDAILRATEGVVTLEREGLSAARLAEAITQQRMTRLEPQSYGRDVASRIAERILDAL